MKRVMAGAAASLALVLAGCGGIDSGTVTEKWYENATSYITLIPIQTGSICSGGSSNVCTPIFTPFPFEVYDDPDWMIKIRREDGDKVKTNKIEVSEAKWNSLKEGDYYSKKDGTVPNGDKKERRG